MSWCKKRAYKLSCLGVAAAALLVAQDVMAQQPAQPTSQFAPDSSVFEQLTDLQRKISILEREVVLEDLRLRRRELDLQMQELERQNVDRQVERERVAREEQESSQKEQLELEREEAIRRAEEDLRISQLRAEREALLRSLELATEQEEAEAAAAAAALVEQEEVSEEPDEAVPSNQVRRRISSAGQQPNLIALPGGGEEPQNPGSPLVSDEFSADLDALAGMIGVQIPPSVTEPAPEQLAMVEIEPPPEPEPVPPVIRRLRGVSGQLTATLVLLNGGEVNVVEGDRIPGNWRIVSIEPEMVLAKHADADDPVPLAFGTRVVDTNPPPSNSFMMAEPQVAAEPSLPEPSMDGGFNPIGSGTIPVPGGFPDF